MNPGHPDGLCEYCQIEGPGACSWGAITCPHADVPIRADRGVVAPKPLTPSGPPPSKPHDDLVLARTLASGSMVWTRDLCAQLASLVERNQYWGSPLQYDGYVAMRDLLWRVGPLLDAQEAACRVLEGLPF
jgi:hypothetical protein